MREELLPVRARVRVSWPAEERHSLGGSLV